MRKTGGHSDLVRAYHQALQAAKSAQDVNAEIAAYGKVIELGQNSTVNEEDIIDKKSLILYWSYNNLGDALTRKNQNKIIFNKGNYNLALDYYQQAYKLARDNTEKIAVLKRMAYNYRLMKDDEAFYKCFLKIIELSKDKDKREAYVALAEMQKNADEAAALYERALEYVPKEDTDVAGKCLNTLQICRELLALYQELDIPRQQNRIYELMNKTAILAVRSLEDKIDSEDNRLSKLELFAKLIEVNKSYLQADDTRCGCLYRRMNDLLKNGEEFEFGGVKYSKTVIRRLLTPLH